MMLHKRMPPGEEAQFDLVLGLKGARCLTRGARLPTVGASARDGIGGRRLTLAVGRPGDVRGCLMISHHVAQLSLAIYGLLLAIGGYIGFRKAGSITSLRAGLIAGVLAFIGAGTVTDNGVLGLKFGAFIAGAMIVVFGIRLARTRKFMPSGMLLGLSVVELLILLVAIL